jgi:DNA-binding NarL/FixJ family response regulator
MRTVSVSDVPDISPNYKSFDEINDLVRQILACVEPGGQSDVQSVEPSSCEEIVFDGDVDGVRYLLVRLPKPTRVAVSLSPREQEIVRMVAQGYANKMIAGVLNISSWTVCTHLRRIFAKLGVTSRAAMVARTMEDGSGREHFRTSEKPEVPAASSRGLKITSAVSGKHLMAARTK